MFCSKCGTQNANDVTECTNCSNIFPKSGTTFQTDKAKEQVKIAINDAWATFRHLGLDPVGGLQSAYQGLGKARSFGVGVAFGLVFAIFFVIAFNQIPFLGMQFRVQSGIAGWIKLLIIGFVPYVALTVSCFIGEKVGKGSGGDIFSNGFVSGVALLPLGIFTLITSIIGVGNVEIVFTLGIVAICLTILILFAGLIRIGNVSEKVASIAVPLMLVISLWIGKVIFVTLFS